MAPITKTRQNHEKDTSIDGWIVPLVYRARLGGDRDGIRAGNGAGLGLSDGQRYQHAFHE
jgi:hypothetical protein